jgi:anti-sigma factor (TIGR02949 family)
MPDTNTKPIPDECMAVLRHVWDYLDGRMTPAAAQALRDHVARCPQCLDYQLFQQSYLVAMQRLRVRNAAPWQVRARVLVTLAKAG